MCSLAFVIYEHVKTITLLSYRMRLRVEIVEELDCQCADQPGEMIVLFGTVSSHSSAWALTHHEMPSMGRLTRLAMGIAMPPDVDRSVRWPR